jgi:hypothetical protein
MAGNLQREELQLLEKIARLGGDSGRVPLSSVLKGDDRRTREILKKLKSRGYLRVQTPEKPSIEKELDELSGKYLEHVKAFAEGDGRKGFSRARESCLLLKECMTRALMERDRVKTRLKKARRKLAEAQVRSRIGERITENTRELTEIARRLESLLVFIESLPAKDSGSRQLGLIDNLDIQLEELDARCKVGEITMPECKRRREAVEKKRRRLKQAVSSHPVNRRLKTARGLLAEMQRNKQITPKKSVELSPR